MAQLKNFCVELRCLPHLEMAVPGETHLTSEQPKDKPLAFGSVQNNFGFTYFVVLVGAGWLLTTIGVTPKIDWVWTISLGIVGVLTFVVGGSDKITFVVGIFFLATSCLSILRQTERISIEVEVPVLVILAGILMLIARLPAIPMRKTPVEQNS